jgi:hypothetical protein
MSGSYMWLLPDASAAAANPAGHAWPAALAAAAAAGAAGGKDGSSSSTGDIGADGASRQVAIKAAVGASLGAVGVVGLLLLACCCWHRKRTRQQQQQPLKGLELGVHVHSRRCSHSSDCSLAGQHRQQQQGKEGAVVSGSSTVGDLEQQLQDQS